MTLAKSISMDVFAGLALLSPDQRSALISVVYFTGSVGRPLRAKDAWRTLGMTRTKATRIIGELADEGHVELADGFIFHHATLAKSAEAEAVRESKVRAGVASGVSRKTEPKSTQNETKTAPNQNQESNKNNDLPRTDADLCSSGAGDDAEQNKNKNKKRKEPKEKNKNKNKIINNITKHARGKNSGDGLGIFDANDPPTDAELVALFELYNESATRAGWQNCRMPPTKNRLEQMRSAVGWAGNVADFKAGLAMAEGLDFLKTKRGGMSVDFLIKGFTENNGVKYQPTIIRILEGGFANDKRYDNTGFDGRASYRNDAGRGGGGQKETPAMRAVRENDQRLRREEGEPVAHEGAESAGGACIGAEYTVS